MIPPLLEWLKALPPEWVTMLVGALPIAEVRGAIPVAIALKLSYPQAFFWSCLGNLLPVVPLLIWLDPVSAGLRRFPLWRGFFDWLFTRTAARAEIVQRYEAIGLALFVAVPLPLTGAWTGCAAASLFKLPFRLAFPAIAAGILGAALIVTLAVRAGTALF
ncbi:MAG: small multi-drug export protein [Candidatus Omnitrophica bacterium]|nr:small multi-drug export protein [Candidatus Omnitrophota bacterium]